MVGRSTVRGILRLYKENLISCRPGKQPLSSSDYASLARFIPAGIDGLILKELAKPSRARSNHAVEALIYGAKQYADNLLRKSER